MTAAEESGGGAEKKNLRSETTEVSCVVCGSANPLSALRCGECGSSDGFGENKPFPALPLRMTEAALGSPAVGRPVRGESPVAEKHKRPLPPPPPPQL
jgi:ribosomal protein L40E